MSLYEYERNGQAQELIRVLRESENPRMRARAAELRMAAANALGELENSDAVPKLVERFDDPDPRDGRRAALGDRGRDRRGPAGGDPRTGEPGARPGGIHGKIGDEETARELESLLDDTEDEQVRERAFSALSKFGGHAGT